MLSLISFLPIDLIAQEDFKIAWDYTDLGFNDFVVKTESLGGMRFFYKNEWIEDLRLGEFHGIVPLSELLDSLFKGKSLYYFFDDAGNVVLTWDFAVKISGKSSSEDQKFIPVTHYEEEEQQKKSWYCIY